MEVPQSGMVYNGKPYFLMDDLGVPPFKETAIYCPWKYVHIIVHIY